MEKRYVGWSILLVNDALLNLLKEIGIIKKKYDEEDRKTGRRFNIYSIANIERDEVKTHSRMIAELLNPKGSHGQDNLFLNLFLRQFDLDPQDSNNATINVEASYRVYGRIDIEIILDNYYIIIENKIDAVDQSRQLWRYNEIAKNTNKMYSIFYLTKYGNSPSKGSLCEIEEDKEIDLRMISYRENIHNWLENCIQQSSFIPNIREGLLQYLNLVKKITGIEKTSVMEHVMEKLLKDPINIQNAGLIANAFNSSKFRGMVLFEFFEKLRVYLLQEDQTFTKIDIDENFNKFNYEERCKEWFERGNTSTGWECVGLFLGIKDHDDLLLHVEVATDALHFGLIHTSNTHNEITNSIVENSKLEKQTFAHKQLNWVSILYLDNIHLFGEKVIELLTNDEKIKGFSKEINKIVRETLFKL